MEDDNNIDRIDALTSVWARVMYAPTDMLRLAVMMGSVNLTRKLLTFCPLHAVDCALNNDLKYAPDGVRDDMHRILIEAMVNHQDNAAHVEERLHSALYHAQTPCEGLRVVTTVTKVTKAGMLYVLHMMIQCSGDDTLQQWSSVLELAMDKYGASPVCAETVQIVVDAAINMPKRAERALRALLLRVPTADATAEDIAALADCKSSWINTVLADIAVPWLHGATHKASPASAASAASAGNDDSLPAMQIHALFMIAHMFVNSDSAKAV